jgi:hypothetical protein
MRPHFRFADQLAEKLEHRRLYHYAKLVALCEEFQPNENHFPGFKVASYATPFG